MTNNPPSAQIKPGEYGFPLKLKARYDNFIGGEWVAPADGEYYQNLTPVTGQLLAGFALIFVAVVCSETKFSFLRKKKSA